MVPIITFRQGTLVTDQLIYALKNPAFYPHPTQDIQLIETHISWVFLTGDYAYKIKKPVNFGFLDFTSLEARKHFCTEELRLNQRLTQDIYLEVLPITGDISTPQLQGEGPAIEYALKMRQFPQSGLLTELHQRGELTSTHIDELASQIADFHIQTPRISQTHPLAQPNAIMAPVLQNFEQVRPLLSEESDLKQLDALQGWAEDSFARLRPLLEQRCANGSIRECHGDIHLGNAALINGKVTLFDCIEFNEPFRFIDVACDAAFLAMDLEDRGLNALSNRFINHWIEQADQYECLPLLSFYKAYRAMVRAKVSLFRYSQEQNPLFLEQYRGYAALAESYSAIPSRFLAITHGTSAIGKSTVALQITEDLGSIRIRSDFERKRLFGEQNAELDGTLNKGIYSAQAGAKTYQRIHQLAQLCLKAGFSAVIDATYLHNDSRQQARDIADSCGVPFFILDCHAPIEIVATWLEERQQAGTDPSDATLEVIAAQEASRIALSEDEQRLSIHVDTQSVDSIQAVSQLIKQQLTKA